MKVVNKHSLMLRNKSARFDFNLYDKLEAGVALNGAEVKSLFAGHASLDGAYIKFVRNELFLLNAHIHPYPFATIFKIEPKRTRKLLLHRKELVVIQSKMKQKNLVLVPLSWYNKGHQIKLEIALAKSKKKWEKKEVAKKRDEERDAEQEIS